MSFPAAPSGISQLSTLSPLIFFETRVCHHITCLPCIHPPPPPPHLANLLKPCSFSYHLFLIQSLPLLVSWWSVVGVAGIPQSSGHQQYPASRPFSPEPLTHLLLACWGIRWPYCHIYSKGRKKTRRLTLSKPLFPPSRLSVHPAFGVRRRCPSHFSVSSH